MPDICKCDYADCNKAKKCYRFMSISDEWQSWAEFKYICGSDNGYKYLYEIDGKPIRCVEDVKVSCDINKNEESENIKNEG